MFLWEWFRIFWVKIFRSEKMISHVRTNLRSVSECIEDILMLLSSTSSLFGLIIMLIVIISDCRNARVILNCKNNRKPQINELKTCTRLSMKTALMQIYLIQCPSNDIEIYHNISMMSWQKVEIWIFGD